MLNEDHSLAPELARLVAAGKLTPDEARRDPRRHMLRSAVTGEEIDMVLKPGMVIMAEPNPITADGLFGIFLGHTFIVNETGYEAVDKFPLEIAVAK